MAGGTGFSWGLLLTLKKQILNFSFPTLPRCRMLRAWLRAYKQAHSASQIRLTTTTLLSDDDNDASAAVKSLVWTYSCQEDKIDKGFVVCVLPTASRANRRLLELAISKNCLRDLRLASPEVVFEMTGYRIGTIPFIGHLRHDRIRIFVDSSLVRSGNPSLVLAGGAGEVEDGVLLMPLDELLAECGVTCVPLSLVHDEEETTEEKKTEGAQTIAVEEHKDKKEQGSEIWIDTGGAHSFSFKTLKRACTVLEGGKYKYLSLEKSEQGTEGVEDFKQLIESLPPDRREEVVHYRTPNAGKTLLHMCAWRGSYQSVQLLLSLKAGIDVVSTGAGNCGKSALFYATTRCRDDVVTLLIRMGASVLIINNKGQTPRLNHIHKHHAHPAFSFHAYF